MFVSPHDIVSLQSPPVPPGGKQPPIMMLMCCTAGMVFWGLEAYSFFHHTTMISVTKLFYSQEWRYFCPYWPLLTGSEHDIMTSWTSSAGHDVSWTSPWRSFCAEDHPGEIILTDLRQETLLSDMEKIKFLDLLHEMYPNSLVHKWFSQWNKYYL